MDGQTEKTRHPTVGPEDWDGPSKLTPVYHVPSREVKFQKAYKVNTH